MKRVITAFIVALRWFITFCFFSLVVYSFPSVGAIFFLIGLAISLPVRIVQIFWEKSRLRYAVKIILLFALLICGSVMTPSDNSVEEAGEAYEVLNVNTGNVETNSEEIAITSDAKELEESTVGSVDSDASISLTEEYLLDEEQAEESLPESEGTLPLEEVQDGDSIEKEETDTEEIIDKDVPKSDSNQSYTGSINLNGRGWSDVGRSEPHYVGIKGYAIISSEYAAHLRWSEDFLETPWPVDIYEKNGSEYTCIGTIEHKTPVLVLSQSLHHRRYGVYEGYLLVRRLDDGSEFYINVNSFITKAYWNSDSVSSAVSTGIFIAEYHQRSEYYPTKNGRTDGERLEIQDGRKVLVVGKTGTSGNGPDRYAYPIEAVDYTGKNGYVGRYVGFKTIHFNSADLTIIY